VEDKSTALWQPTDQNICEYFDDVIGSKAWEKGKPSEAIIELDTTKFPLFIASLSQLDKEKLLEILRRYDGCMSAINENAFPYGSALQITVLTGLIELTMGKITYITLAEYLDQNVNKDKLISKENLNELINSYYVEYGQRKAYLKFFNDYITDNEKKQILDYLKNCPEWKDCDDIKSFVSQLEPYRNKFVHELSPETLWPYQQKLILGVGFRPMEIYPTISPPYLMGIIWRGVLRKFGYVSV